MRRRPSGVVSNVCNHVGGPLGEGRLEGDYIVCPWHDWKFHRCTGAGEPGFETDACRASRSKSNAAEFSSIVAGASRRNRAPHAPHPLARPIVRAAGPLRLAGVSTTAMDGVNPRFSGSDHLLGHALREADGSAPRLGSSVSTR